MKQSNQIQNSSFHYNVIPFRFSSSEIKVGFLTEESRDKLSVPFGAVPKDVQEHFKHLKAAEQPAKLYLLFDPPKNYKGLVWLVDLYQHRMIARLYAHYLLHQHFTAEQAYLQSNFVRDLVVWVYQRRNADFGQFSRLQLRVRFYEDDAQPSLVVSYAGDSYILVKNLAELDTAHPEATGAVKRVIYDKQISHFDALPIEALSERDKIFPLLDRELARKLSIVIPFKRVTNKHEVHWDKVQQFVAQKINKQSIKKLNFDGEWQHTAPQLMLEGKELALQFGQGKTDFDIYQGLKKYGPFKALQVKQLVCFFIYTAKDEPAKQKLQQALMPESGYGGLGNFLKVGVFYNSELDIVLEKNERMSEQVADQISQESLDPSLAYLAVYVSPFDKFTAHEDQKRVYHQIKEVLLKRHIASQTIVGSKLSDPKVKLHYWIPNVAMAVIAKLGGVPWILHKPHQPSLVVGFGLYRSLKYDLRYEGSSFVFGADGHFKGFEYYPASETSALAARLEEAFDAYLSRYGKPERLVIHYYKKMSKRDFEPVRRFLKRYDPGLPVFVVRVNQGRTEDFFVRDTTDTYGLPVDGTVFRLIGQDYLLYVNGYDGGTKPRLQPMPVRCYLQASDPALLEDEQTVKELLQQVYDFSRLYWRSVNQPAIPVTVEYPRLLAAQTAWFDGKSVPGGLSELPWFL